MMGVAAKKGTQRLYQLEGTPQSSTTQLTDPPLYSIFGGRNTIYTENQDIELTARPSEPEIEMLGKTGDGEKRTQSGGLGKQQQQQQLVATAPLVVLDLVKASVFGIALCLLFGSVHDSNPETIPEFYYHMFRWGGKGDRCLPVIVVNSCVLDALICLVLFGIKSYVLPAAAVGGGGAADAGRNTSILQLSVALLGIAYCFKKLSWSSTLQADLTLMLLNVFFSRYLGCTVEEVLTAAAVFAGAYAYDLVTLHPSFELSLWKASFMFFTAIIFIKLRRSTTLF